MEASDANEREVRRPSMETRPTWAQNGNFIDARRLIRENVRFDGANNIQECAIKGL